MIYSHPILETERLIMKRGSYEDYVKVYEYDFTRLRDIAGEFEFVKQDPEKIRGYESEVDNTEFMLDYIVYLKTGEPICNIVLDRYDKDKKSLEISINLHPNYWGCGYGKEAILEIMRYAFDNLDIEYIIYGYAIDNIKSKRLSEKLGFEYYNTRIEYYKRLDKNIEHEENIMSKEQFYEKYGSKKVK